MFTFRCPKKKVGPTYKTSTALTRSPPLPSDDKHISAEGASVSRRLEWGGWCTCSWAVGRSHLQSLFLISLPPRGANISISMRRRREGELLLRPPLLMSDFAPRREGGRENRRRHFPYFWSEGCSFPGGLFRGLLRRGDGRGGDRDGRCHAVAPLSSSSFSTLFSFFAATEKEEK